MEIGNVGASALAENASDAVGILVLKKAIEAQGSAAQQLIAAVPKPASNPPNLGQRVDVRA
jgi:hypothetical protein